jgi:hypothetical protein
MVNSVKNSKLAPILPLFFFTENNILEHEIDHDEYEYHISAESEFELCIHIRRKDKIPQGTDR